MGENEQGRGRSGFGGQAQTAGDGEIDGMPVGVGDDEGKGAGLESFLDGPQEVLRFAQAHCEQPVARHAETGEAVTIKSAPFAIGMAEPDPEQRTQGALRHQQTAQCKTGGKTHGSGGIGIGAGGNLMDGVRSKTKRRQTGIDRRYTQGPGKVGNGRQPLDSRNAGAQSSQQSRRLRATPWCCIDLGRSGHVDPCVLVLF